MEENPEIPVESKPEILAEYRFIITFETYPDKPAMPEELVRGVMNEIDRALAKDFANEVEFLFSGLVRVRVNPLEQGSILGSVTLILVGAVTIAEFISKYKDFYESLVLLRSQLRAVLSGILNRMLPQKIYRTVNITFVPGSATRAVSVAQIVPHQVAIPAFYSKAFFIYLLMMNIVLVIIIFTLVYHAVAEMYFSTP